MSLNISDSPSEFKPNVFRRHAQAKDKTERARQELTELVADLDRRGVGSFEMLLRVSRRNALLGYPVQSVLPLIRSLPGLQRWDPLANWSARIDAAGGRDPASLATDLDPEFAEVHRRSRAYVLSEWLRFRGGSDIAEEVVAAAEKIALRHAGEGVTDA